MRGLYKCVCVCACLVLASLIVISASSQHQLCTDGTRTHPNLATTAANSSVLDRAICLQNSQCAPAYTCEYRLTLPQWDICLDTLYDEDGRCLVYSVGIANEWMWDLFMARLGCEVFMFDPTVSLPSNFSDNVSFHKWGLYGGNRNNSDAATFKHPQYGKIDGEMKTLHEVEVLLGHQGRTISVFKIDCEGCEWEVLGTLNVNGLHRHALHKVQQLLIEMHFSTTLGLKSVDRFQLVGNTFDLLWPHTGNSTVGGYLARFYHNVNPGFEYDKILLPELIEAGFPSRLCCREAGFVRASCLEFYASAAQKARRAANFAKAKQTLTASLEGHLVKGKYREPEVYLVKNGTRHAFKSIAIFTSYGYDFQDNHIERDFDYKIIDSGLDCCLKGAQEATCCDCSDGGRVDRADKAPPK